jgi:hypothetical protein
MRRARALGSGRLSSSYWAAAPTYLRGECLLASEGVRRDVRAPKAAAEF